MTSEMTQKNKNIVWEYWQKLGEATPDNSVNILKTYLSEDTVWAGPYPINQLKGAEAIAAGYWLPLLQSFPDLKRETFIFFGGASNGRIDGQGDGREWVCGLGNFKGTFQHDWLSIPATGSEINIRWSEFCRLEDGKIVETQILLDVYDVMRQAGYPVLPPDRGAVGLWLPPQANDGLLLTEQDEQDSQESLRLIRAMIYDGLNSFDQSELQSMGMAQYFDTQLQWYGPGGIGICRSLQEFEEFHQKHWLIAFPDRQVQDLDSLFAEGCYMGASGWSGVIATHTGQYLDAAPTGNTIYFNGVDIWKRDGDKLVENWVFVDMVDVFRQFGVDLFERMKQQIAHKHST